MATHRDFCSYCLSCDRGLFKYSLQRSPSLQSVFQVEELLFCYVCTKFAKNAEEFIQKVGNAQKMFGAYGVVDTSTLDTIRQRMQPLRYFNSLYLDLIHISPEEAENFTEKDDKHKTNICGEKIQENDTKVEIKLEKLQNNDDDDFLDPTYFDMKDDLVAEEVDLKLLKKETAKKRGRPKKKKKREEKDDLMEEIKRKTKPKEKKPKDYSYVELIHLSPSEQQQDRAAQASSKRYLDSPYKCEECIKGFNLKTGYNRHMAKHRPSRGEYECEICKIRISSKRLLEAHVRNHSLRYKCKICNIVRVNRKTIKYHYSVRHDTDAINVHKCPECGKIRRCRESLLRHMSHAHSEHARAVCDYCQKSLRKSSLPGHIATHHSDSIKSYACEQCERRFMSRSHLTRHMLTHAHSKEFYCVECDKNYKSLSGLNNHLANTLSHVSTKELRYPCSQCDRRFSNKRDQDNHINAYHRNYRPFKCDKCDKAYVSSWYLKHHSRLVHEGYKRPRKWPCKYCDMVFDRNEVLKGHTRIHTGEKPYQCDICLRRFTQPNTMRSHRNVVHLKLTRNGQQKPNSYY